MEESLSYKFSDKFFRDIDIKAEIVATEFILNGINEDNIYFFRKGGFKRQFSRDIESLEKDNYGNLIININRDGIYDILPEGIFHLDDNEAVFSNEEKISEDSKRRNNEEKEARKFFQPIENEFVHLLRKLENLESENQNHFSALFNKDLFKKIYGYIPEFNDIQIAKLLHFLPLAHKLRGNLDMIGFMLKNLLGKEVTVELKRGFIELFPYDANNLVNMILGVNSIIGSSTHIKTNLVILKFSQLKKSETESFYLDGTNMKIIQKIMSFFLPLGYSYHNEFDFQEEDRYAETLSDLSYSYLGYNSTLN